MIYYTNPYQKHKLWSGFKTP